MLAVGAVEVPVWLSVVLPELWDAVSVEVAEAVEVCEVCAYTDKRY